MRPRGSSSRRPGPPPTELESERIDPTFGMKSRHVSLIVAVIVVVASVVLWWWVFPDAAGPEGTDPNGGGAWWVFVRPR